MYQKFKYVILVLVTFQFWWHFRFGGTSVIGEFQLFRCHLSFCDIWVMVTLKFQRHFSFGDISPIPTRKSANLNISSHGVHPPTTTTKNTQNIEPLQVFFVDWLELRNLEINNENLDPWIEDQKYWNVVPTIVNILLFSNPNDKVLNIVESTGQICLTNCLLFMNLCS